MNEPQHDLAATLRELRAELQNPEGLDEASRELLRQLASDIDKLVGSSAGDAQGGHQGVIDRLRLGVERFEASHPALTANLSMAINALSRMGI